MRNRFSSRHTLTACLLICCAAPLAADITYIDAIADPAVGTVNTVATNGAALTTWYDATANSGDTNATQWVRRSGSIFGNGASDVLQAKGGAGNAIPELKTTLTGLTPGATYELYSFFWDASGGEAWTLDSGLTSGSLTSASGQSSTDSGLFTADGYAANLTFTSVVETGDTNPENTISGVSNRDMLYKIIGSKAADSNGEIDIFIDQTSTALARRAWYDGIGYEIQSLGATQFVDANETNTIAPSLASPTSFSTTSLGTGNLWRKRTGFGFDTNGNSEIYEKDAAGGVGDAAALETTITGLTPGQEYGVYVCFLSVPDEGWQVQAGLQPDSLRVFTRTVPDRITDLGQTGVANSNRNQYLGFIDNQMADSNGEIVVYIDDGAGSGSSSRTWYEGVAVGAPFTVPEPPPAPGGAVEIAPNGVWTWFNDERAIFHKGFLYSGYVRSDGHVGLTRFDPVSGTSDHMQLSDSRSQEVDDHNNPSITVIDGDRLLVTYARHNTAREFYYRTSQNMTPSSDSDWDPQQVRSTPSASTYANTYRLSAENGRIFNFSRSINFNPTLTFGTQKDPSNNDPAVNEVTYGTPQHFIRTGTGGTRPYPRYVSNETNRIDLIYTDGHPRQVNNSIYHLYYEADHFRHSDGSIVKSINSLPLEHDSGERGTEIYQFNASPWTGSEGPDDYIPNARAWTWDIHYGKDGNPVCVFQAQVNNVMGSSWQDDRIYYYYARWNGSSWEKRFIAQAGRGIYNAERDYGGGMSLDPEDPRIVYISSNAASPFDLNSISNVPLNTAQRYEIYRGFTNDGGKTFTWETITENSAQDNLRPIVPKNHDRTEALVWFNGRYTTYLNYDCRVLARLGDEVTDFNSYAESQSLNGSPTADQDSDGYSDLFEFAMQSNPNDPSSTPQITNLGNLNFGIPALGMRAGVDLMIESSTDLSNWDSAAIIRADHLPSETFPGFSMDGTTIKSITSDTPNEPKRFYRAFLAE